MGTIAKIALSGSTQGRPIQVSATGTPGTTIHTTGISATVIDEIWLYATNNDTVSRNLTIEFGSTGTANEISVAIPPKSGLSIIATGLVLRGDGSAGLTVAAFASATNVISLVGYVNRITP
jgi:hypothetical protein